VIDVGDALIVESAVDAAPATNRTVAVGVADDPLTEKVSVATVPATVVDVSSATNTPPPIEVAAPMDPAEVKTSTVLVPVGTGLPNASRSVTLTSDVDDPSAVISVGVATISDVDVDGAPATKSMLAVAGAAFPPTVKDTVAVPTVVALVTVAL
jgi:hypothetical protein